MTTLKTAPVTQEALDAFVAAGQAKINAQFAKYYENLKPSILQIATGGQRYIKITKSDAGADGKIAPDGQTSVWAFVERETGLIFKPAGWKAPAKHARGTIWSEQHGGDCVEWTGPRYLR
jgi:hypothetical protein